jgi:hypothetical protein
MHYTRIIPYLHERHPDVITDFFDASSDEEAVEMVAELAWSGQKLMDLAVNGWRSLDELKGLDMKELLNKYGIAFGVIQVRQGERLVALIESVNTLGSKLASLRPAPEVGAVRAERQPVPMFLPFAGEQCMLLSQFMRERARAVAWSKTGRRAGRRSKKA